MVRCDAVHMVRCDAVHMVRCDAYGPTVIIIMQCDDHAIAQFQNPLLNDEIVHT